MKIAVTHQMGQVFQHFGHAKQFKLYEIIDGTVVSARVVNTVGSGHGAVADFLKENGADVLICGGIGGGAKNALTEAGIEFYGGVTGGADAAVVAFVTGTLQYDPDAHCDHHDHKHG